MLNRRTPVSETLAVAANAAMFLINTEFDPDVRVSYLPGHTAAVAWTMPAPEHFCLLDVVAPDIPSFAAILGSLGISPTIAETRFRPDKLGWSGEPIALEGDARLMLRGLDGVRLDHAAMLSPMADF